MYVQMKWRLERGLRNMTYGFMTFQLKFTQTTDQVHQKD